MGHSDDPTTLPDGGVQPKKMEDFPDSQLRLDLEDAMVKLRFVHRVLDARSKARLLMGGRAGILAGAIINLEETFWRIEGILARLDDKKL